MANEDRRDLPMARPDRPRERDAVRTTIVGGRPPGSGVDIGPIPRGIEVLVKKASVDAKFKALLLEKRAEAAEAIALALEPAEAMMIDAVPAAQLEAIIEHTTVSDMTRAAFLGRAAAVMVAALGAAAVAERDTAEAAPSRGIRPGFQARFVLYSVADWKGDVTYHVAATGDYGPKVARTLRANRFLKRAHAEAAKAWGQDPKNEGVPFPMKAPEQIACRMIGRYGQKGPADAVLKKRQGADKKQRKADEEKEKRRLAALSDADRAKAVEQAKRLAAAHLLYQKRLDAIVNELGDVRPAPPRVILGLRPVRGLRPLRP